jgi:cold shock CspA family protein
MRGETLKGTVLRWRADQMIGIIKKIDALGFGIIDGADGSKVTFIRADVMNHHLLEPGQKVMFSVRRVKDQPFAEHVIVMGERHNWSGG